MGSRPSPFPSTAGSWKLIFSTFARPKDLTSTNLPLENQLFKWNHQFPQNWDLNKCPTNARHAHV